MGFIQDGWQWEKEQRLSRHTRNGKRDREQWKDEWLCCRCGKHNYLTRQDCRECGQTSDGNEEVLWRTGITGIPSSNKWSSGAAEHHSGGKNYYGATGAAGPGSPKAAAPPSPGSRTGEVAVLTAARGQNQQQQQQRKVTR